MNTFVKRLLYLFTSFFLLLLKQDYVYAQIVINEVFPNPSGDSAEATEFIELYNTDETNNVDISGFVLKETKSFTIPENTVLFPNSHISFMRGVTGLALNNTGDTIKLINKDGNEIDSFTYESSDEDWSWSRYPDGSGQFFKTSTVTKDSNNIVAASPTPTNVPTSTPTNVPTEKPAPSPKPTQQVVPTKLLPSIKPSNIPTKSVLSETDQKTEDDTSQDMVTNDSDTKNDNQDKHEFPVFSLLFIGGGVCFLSTSAYLLLKGKKNYNQEI